MTSLCPRWLSSTTWIFSASLQCRRRGASSADRISIWGGELKVDDKVGLIIASSAPSDGPC